MVPRVPTPPRAQVTADDAHLLAASEDRAWTVWDVNQARRRTARGPSPSHTNERAGALAGPGVGTGRQGSTTAVAAVRGPVA
jgi:hypothetical protein